MIAVLPFKNNNLITAHTFHWHVLLCQAVKQWLHNLPRWNFTYTFMKVGTTERNKNLASISLILIIKRFAMMWIFYLNVNKSLIIILPDNALNFIEKRAVKNRIKYLIRIMKLCHCFLLSRSFGCNIRPYHFNARSGILLAIGYSIHFSMIFTICVQRRYTKSDLLPA